MKVIPHSVYVCLKERKIYFLFNGHYPYILEAKMYIKNSLRVLLHKMKANHKQAKTQSGTNPKWNKAKASRGRNNRRQTWVKLTESKPEWSQPQINRGRINRKQTNCKLIGWKKPQDNRSGNTHTQTWVELAKSKPEWGQIQTNRVTINVSKTGWE